MINVALRDVSNNKEVDIITGSIANKTSSALFNRTSETFTSPTTLSINDDLKTAQSFDNNGDR